MMKQISIEHVLPPSDSERLEKLFWKLDEVIEPQLSERVDIKEFAAKLSTKADIFYVKYGESDVGSCAVYMNNEKYGYISSIALKKEWQGKGIGKELLNTVIKELNKKEIRFVELRVNENNVVALSLYKKLAFYEEKRDSEWIQMVRKIDK